MATAKRMSDIAMTRAAGRRWLLAWRAGTGEKTLLQIAKEKVLSVSGQEKYLRKS